MLILNQQKNKAVNVDSCESIEIDYSVGSAYGIKAVMESDWTEPGGEYSPRKSTIRLGVYKTSKVAESIIFAISQSYANKGRLFIMPEDNEEWF